jgi:tellurite resistance protein TerC
LLPVYQRQPGITVLENALQAIMQISSLELAAFIIPFVVAVAVDLASHRSAEPVTLRDAAFWSVIWILCSVGFGGFVWWVRGQEAASLFATGYVLEKALAVDNLFAFYLIFKSFGLIAHANQHHQHRILYWGILGAILLRVLFLGLGAMVVKLSPYMLVLFALVVLWTVYKMWTSEDEDGEAVDYTRHWSVRLVERLARTNPSIGSGRFFHHGVTPLFLCLVCIEACDVVFAFDSMPVIVAVVQEPYLMITSSLWAAAGLRSLYFLLVAAQNLFWALDKAVMLLLVFVSLKLMASAAGIHVPNELSLSVIALTLGAGIGYSLLFKQPDADEPVEEIAA